MPPFDYLRALSFTLSCSWVKLLAEVPSNRGPGEPEF